MSSDPAIRVDCISKYYRIGGPRERYRTLRDTLANALTRPARRALRLLRGNPAGAADLVDKIWALKDVSFEVAAGEVVGVIGRNGAGKSTLLKVLSRITEPSSGEARVVGRVASLLEVGTGFHPELTGRENVYLSGAILGMRRAEIRSKLEAILSFAEVERFADTPVKHYSSGMYLRLAFSVAAHLDPEILLVDEVLAVGDDAFRKKCLRKLGEATRTGRTVLFVSHNMAAIQSLCPRTLLLENGRVELDGSTAQAIERYLTKGQPTSGPLALADYRTTRGPGVFRALAVTDDHGHERRVFPIGDDVVLSFSLTLHEQARNPEVGVGVNNILGTRIFTLRTGWQKYELGTLSGDVVVHCRLRDLRLVPGQYYLKATFGDHHTDLDVIEDVPAFEIMPDDHWSSGSMPAPISQGLLLQDAIWSHEESE